MPTIIFLALVAVMIAVAAALYLRDRGKPRTPLNWSRELSSMRGVGRTRHGRFLVAGIVLLLCAVVASGADAWPAPLLFLFSMMCFLSAFCWYRYQKKEYALMRADMAAAQHPPTLPPIWPPRKPDKWGNWVENAHRRAMLRHRPPAPPPVMAEIPSWEAYHLAEQTRHPRQIRWARTEQGEWHKIEWGNAALVPASGVLPVLQIMQEITSGHWQWVLIGEGAVSLDWQEGPARFETFSQQGSDGRVVQYRRPVGTAGVTPTPLPIEPGGEHGDSREQSVDDLVRAGIVAPR